VAKLTRVVYSISPWSAVAILVLQATILGVTATIIRGPGEARVVKVMVRAAPRSVETHEQHALTHEQDVVLCERACITRFVSVKQCHWMAGGSRVCECGCSGTFNNENVEEQR
jgi:hypothetical protein